MLVDCRIVKDQVGRHWLDKVSSLLLSGLETGRKRGGKRCHFLYIRCLGIGHVEKHLTAV